MRSVSWSRRRFLRAGLVVYGAGLCGSGCNGTGDATGAICTAPTAGRDPVYCLLEAVAVRVTGAAGLAVGEALLTNVDDNTAVIVARDAGGFHALSGICTHACCIVSLCGDTSCADLTITPGSCEPTRVVRGDHSLASILCPCHGSTFRLADGVALTGPAVTALPTYALVFDGDDVVVDTGAIVDARARYAPGTAPI